LTKKEKQRQKMRSAKKKMSVWMPARSGLSFLSIPSSHDLDEARPGKIN